ncbi:MAG TPA: LacI family DNA-binding transcriptional regulator [Pseudonocardiaceae bacterium]
MVTISDVARHAGVSPSTVSYVLSGKRSISAETRRRVERSVRKLGYHPHAGARALASSRTNVLALVVPLRVDLNVPVVMQFVGAAVTSARAYDHDLLLLTKDEGPDGLRRIAASAIADAIIVMDVEFAEPRVPVLQSLRRPAVLIGVPAQPGDLTCVDLDFTAAGSTCVAHLADLGHRKIALVGPSPAVYERGTSYAGRFRLGFDATAAERGLRALARPCLPTYDGLRGCLDEILRRQPGTTGIVVHNEAVVPALLAELRARRLRVPRDMSVVAVCPDDMVDNHGIALTSVAIPTAEVGQLAVELAMRQLDGVAQPEIRLLSPRLTTRDSTAIAGRRRTS